VGRKGERAREKAPHTQAAGKGKRKKEKGGRIKMHAVFFHTTYSSSFSAVSVQAPEGKKRGKNNL